MAFKINISKAYDRVDWGYLKAILLQLGFSSNWVGLLMLCVTTVQYSILLNGKELGPIVPKRGLRQGDSLSPYLFILCVEGLSALFRKAERHGELYGCRILRRAPSISHLLLMIVFSSSKQLLMRLWLIRAY